MNKFVLKTSETRFQNAETRFENAKTALSCIFFARTWMDSAQKKPGLCLFLRVIYFGVTCAFENMWYVIFQDSALWAEGASTCRRRSFVSRLRCSCVGSWLLIGVGWLWGCVSWLPFHNLFIGGSIVVPASIVVVVPSKHVHHISEVQGSNAGAAWWQEKEWFMFQK